MTIVALIPVFVAVLGALAYALSSNAKVAELGRLAFLAGCAAACLVFATQTIKL